MSPRHVVLSESRGINTPRFVAGIARVTPLFATLTSHPLTTSKHATLTLLFATLTRNVCVSPLLATLTKNTGGGGRVRTLPHLRLRYFLTLFPPSPYTRFSLLREEPCT